MANPEDFDWDPHAGEVQKDQIAAYDRMRARCPVARSKALHRSLFRHADVLRVLLAHDEFSNAVSIHRSVPNGMDPPGHTPYRRLIEPYFAPERMRAFEPVCRRIATALVARLRRGEENELIGGFAQDFALQVQCAFMGWPGRLHEPLRQWMLKNQLATLAGDRAATAAVAREFDGYIRAILAERRAQGNGADRDDVTGRLMRECIDGRALADDDIVSIVRNWTVGELGTIAASVGIVAHYLARHPDVQRALRRQPDAWPAAIDEILRIDAPLIANRRVATRGVTIGGRRIAAGERVTVLWPSANRDEAVFGAPDAFRLDRDPAPNLLYGAGIHVCPGAPLARLELRVVVEALFAGTSSLTLSVAHPPVRATYPAGGYSRLTVIVD